MESYTSILATLAKNNINLMHWDKASQTLEFEFQWRCNRTMTKWTKCLVPLEPGKSFVEHGEALLQLVRDLRGELEK